MTAPTDLDTWQELVPPDEELRIEAALQSHEPTKRRLLRLADDYAALHAHNEECKANHLQTVAELMQAEADNAALRQRCEQAEADARRLDWLAREFSAHGCITANRYGPGSEGCELFTVTAQHVRGRGLRDAIDVATGKGAYALGSVTASLGYFFRKEE